VSKVEVVKVYAPAPCITLLAYSSYETLHYNIMMTDGLSKVGSKNILNQTSKKSLVMVSL